MRNRIWGGRRGNVMVELAASAPLFLMCFTTCFQYGYYFYIYNRLENAVRAGARYASVRSYDSNDSTPSSAFSTGVKNMVVYGNPSGGNQTVVPGLTGNNVALSVTMENGLPSQMKVYVTGYKIFAVFGTWTLSTKPVAVFRYEGRLGKGND